MRFRALHDLDLPATCRANRSGCFCARIAAIGVDALYERKAGACLPQQFDGGRLSSYGGVMLHAMADQRLDYVGLTVPEFCAPSAVIRTWIASGATSFGDEISSITPAWG
jgi:hypothetical protein